MTQALQVINNELQQAFAQAPTFLLREQGQNDNLASLGRAKAVANNLSGFTGDPARQAASPDVFGPRFSCDAVRAQPFF